MPRLSPGGQTLAGQVMHDLGEWSYQHNRPAGQREALRFAAARIAAVGEVATPVDVVARQALRDWRATSRLQRAGPTGEISAAYPSGVSGTDVIGARVVLDLIATIGGRRVPQGSVVVLVNAQAGLAAEQAVALAIAAFNERRVESSTRQKYLGTTAVQGDIVQLVEGGWTHAQVGEQI
jgi:hypothetical protein